METILQFGVGKFLRAFADLFVHQANSAGQDVGRIVAVQTTPGNRANALNRQNGFYRVLVRGVRDGEKVEQVEEVGSISRALVAAKEWPAVLEVARSPDLRFILSNATEAGYALEPEDVADELPLSFPAKLLQALIARCRAGLPGVTILPCELFEQNADRLRSVVLDQAQRWRLAESERQWVETSCAWRNSLVDRIVAGTPTGHPMLQEDPLLIAAEPYALWAVERAAAGPQDPLFEHPALVQTDNVMPYHLRKLRILNGAHTALVAKALPLGFRTVRQAILNRDINHWLRQLLFEEIVPVVASRVEDAQAFAEQTLERFANPFLDHKLSDIALHHETKIRLRLVPTRDEHLEMFGKGPPLLAQLLDAAPV